MKQMIVGIDLYNQSMTGGVSKTLNSIRSDPDHVPCVLVQDAYGFKPGQGSAARTLGWEKEKAPSLTATHNCAAGVLVNTLVFDEGQITCPTNGLNPQWNGACHSLSGNTARTVVIIKDDSDSLS